MDQQNPPPTENFQVVTDVTVVGSVISIVASSLLLLAFFAFNHYYSSLTDRTTLRIIVVLAGVDVVYSFNQIAAVYISFDQPFWCAFSTWQYIQLTLLSLFLTDAISLNIQLLLFHQCYGAMRSLEKWYYIVPLIASCLLPLPAWLYGRFGWDPYQRTCWFADPYSTTTFIWKWLSFYIWLLLGIIYCVVVVAWVLFKLYRQAQSLSTMDGNKERNNNTNQSSVLSTVRTEAMEMSRGLESQQVSQVTLVHSSPILRQKRVLIRILRYPMIPVFTQTFNLINDLILSISHKAIVWIIAVSFFASAIQGFLNFAAFCFDPSVETILDQIKEDSIHWYLQTPEPDALSWYESLRYKTIGLIYRPSRPSSAQGKQGMPIDSRSIVDAPLFNKTPTATGIGGATILEAPTTTIDRIPTETFLRYYYTGGAESEKSTPSTPNAMDASTSGGQDENEPVNKERKSSLAKSIAVSSGGSSNTSLKSPKLPVITEHDSSQDMPSLTKAKSNERHKRNMTRSDYLRLM